MNKNVKVPSFLKEGVKVLLNPYPKRIKLLVFDTETYSQGAKANGEAYLLIFYDGKKVFTRKVNNSIINDVFLDYLLEHCTSKKHSYILLAHNLPFDLTAVFDKYSKKLFVGTSSIYEHYDRNGNLKATIKFFTHKIWFAQIKLANGVSVKAVDSIAFTLASIPRDLYTLSRILNFKHKKRKKPIFLGRKPKNAEEWKDLHNYCYAEIKAEYELAEWVLKLHEKYDVTFCVSIAQLSSKIFRKHFLKTTIPQIPDHIRKLAEYTIHGGRASTFVRTPCLIFDVKMYDYNSFYSFAMGNLPNITEGKWKKITRFDNEHEGFYWISGFVKPCKYPLIIKSIASMIFANNDYVYDIPITSYELREAFRNHEVNLHKIEGYVWIPHKNAVNPFKSYVEHFYEEKTKYQQKTSLYRQAKLLLNSLYGKTYQTLLDEESQHQADCYVDLKHNRLVGIEKFWRAGGLYLPHVGSWITSQCRAILHKSLHDYEGIDCSTDSFKTNMTIPTDNRLGGLKLVSEGMLMLLRPKLYVMFSLEKQKEFLDSTLPFTVWLKRNLSSLEIGKDKDIVKFATHGFWSKVSKLLDMIAKGKHTYQITRMRKIREALKQHKNARVMFEQTRSLNVNWSDIDSSISIAEEYGKIENDDLQRVKLNGQ